MKRHVHFPCRMIRSGKMKSVGFDSFRFGAVSLFLRFGYATNPQPRSPPRSAPHEALQITARKHASQFCHCSARFRILRCRYVFDDLMW